MTPDERKRANQRGIALMMTLGMLSLILIMAMSFSFQSQTNKIAAGNNADMVRARLLCESALERVLASLALNFDGTEAADIYPPRYSAVMPASARFDQYTAGTYAQHYWIWQSGTDDEGFQDAVVVDGLPEGLKSLLSAGRWQHVTIPQDVDNDSNDDIAGRIAYLVLDESGKIDVSSVVTPNHEPYYDSDNSGDYTVGEFFFDINPVSGAGYTTSAVPEGSEAFVGGSPQEIKISDVFRTGLPVLSGVDRDGNGADDRTEWFSLPHLLAVFDTAFDYGKYTAFSYDLEAYKNASGTDIHRFDLSGYDWDPDTSNTISGWDDVSMSDVDYVTWLQGGGGGVSFWSGGSVNAVPDATTSTAGGGLIWLGGMVDGSSNSVTRQVAANIIDYCDSDSRATVATTDGLGDPSVVGLEKVPYVNEAAVSLAYLLLPNLFTSDYSHTFTMTVEVELANIYDQDLSCNVSVEIGVNFNDRKDAAISLLPASDTLTGTKSGITVSANSYYHNLATLSFNYIKNLSTTDSKGQVRPEIQMVKVTVTTADGLGDFAKCTTVSGVTGPMSVSTAGLVSRYNSLEVADPRLNTVSDNWNWVSTNFSNSENHTLGLKNSNSDATTGGEETLSNVVAGISTAFIRNAPMISLWELGCIHRGEPWKTINLKSYGGNVASDYTNGDAGMLDQVKIGPQKITRGKINVNAPCEAVWSEILEDICIDDPYDAPGTGSSHPASSMAQSIASAGGAWDSRGAIADILSADGGASNDREREAALGKLANLLTVRQNMFTVVIAAQAVKELGTVDPGNGTTDDNYYEYTTNRFCARLSEQKVLAVVYRDALQNTLKVRRFQFLEN